MVGPKQHSGVARGHCWLLSLLSCLLWVQWVVGSTFFAWHISYRLYFIASVFVLLGFRSYRPLSIQRRLMMFSAFGLSLDGLGGGHWQIWIQTYMELAFDETLIPWCFGVVMTGHWFTWKGTIWFGLVFLWRFGFPSVCVSFIPFLFWFHVYCSAIGVARCIVLCGGLEVCGLDFVNITCLSASLRLANF